MTTTTTWAIDGTTTPAEIARRMLAGLVATAGVDASGALAVSERAAGANNSWDIAAGGAFFVISGEVWHAHWDATNIPAPAADDTDARIDLILAEVRNDDVNDDARVYVLAGTPGGAEPTPPAGSVVLARADVPAGAPSMVDAYLTDRRDRAGHVAGGPRRTLILTASTTFTPADYPWLRAVKARVQAGGGAGGGAIATGAGGVSSGTGGSGGSYAEAFRTVEQLGTSETVTVGTGGAGASGANGGSGGTSAFGSHAVAAGGSGGTTKAETTAGRFEFQTGPGASQATAGDVQAGGQAGGTAFLSQAGDLNRGMGGTGGSSPLGGGGRGLLGNSNPGGAGTGYGGGGGGAGNGNSQSAQPGGNGAPGVVILELHG